MSRSSPISMQVLSWFGIACRRSQCRGVKVDDVSSFEGVVAAAVVFRVMLVAHADREGVVRLQASSRIARGAQLAA